MDLKIEKGEFLALLKWSQGIVEKRGTMPILSNVLIEATTQGLKISATDLEISIICEGKAEVKAGGKIVVNARNLYEIIREAPDKQIRLHSKGEGVEIVSGKSRFRMVSMNPEEYPTLTQISSKSEMKLDGVELEDMIRKTYYAASTDETRYTLNGLYLIKISRTGKNFLRLVATDGHRLSYIERENEKSLDLGKGIIIPRKGISEVRHLIESSEGEMSVGVDERAIRFQKGSVSLTIRLIEGDFPAYEQVIPQKSEKIVSVERESLVGALRRASIMTSEQSRGVRFAFAPGQLTISASHADLGEANEEVAIEYKESAFQIGFNPRYFLDLLAVLQDEKVILEFKDEVSPCVIRSEFDRGFLALVMPMRI